MLQQFKQIFPEGWSWTRRAFGMESSRLRSLKTGQTLCFGMMEQSELNHARLTVATSKEYEFPQGVFSAYGLQHDGKLVCWMIVASVQGSTPYLAISRKLSAHDLDNLLADEDLQILSHSSRLKQLFLREQTPGLREWITMRYERRIEGIRGKQRENETERVFEYELYVSEKNDRAIEIERYLDGHMDAFATIYRPISDILEVIEPRQASVVARAKPEVKPAASIREAPPPAQKIRRRVGQEASLKDVEETRKISKHKPQPVTALPPAPVANGVSAANAQKGRLECDIATAWRLIDEALRGDMRLSDVVRKVLGLPLSASEMVSFDFTLTPEDYVELGRRFGLNPQNQAAIRARIVQELEAFAGKNAR